MMRTLLLSGSLAWFVSACSLGEPGSLGAPEVRAGLTGRLPSVVEIRMSDTCQGTGVPITIRFSQPMDRANVEAAVAILEVRGDATAGVLPLASTPAAIASESIRWENRDQSFTFTAQLNADIQYVLTLPETVTNKAGLGLDGRVGADVDGDGNEDIVSATGDLARIDDDFLRSPSPFVSLPFFLCRLDSKGKLISGSDYAPSVWRTPLHDARPRVIEFVGLTPTSEQVPRYTPESGLFPFASDDGFTVVQKPLPAKGALRIQATAPNTAPTESFARFVTDAPILPSTLAVNFEVIDDELKDYKASAYLDDRLQVQSPLVGTVDQITAANKLVSSALSGVPTDALAGMSLLIKGRDNLAYVLRIIGNSGTELTLDPVYGRSDAVSRDEGAFQSLHFHKAAFRENELRGFKAYGGLTPSTLSIEGNSAAFVRIQSGTINCPPLGGPVCPYDVLLDLAAMEAEGKSFEVVPQYIYFQTAQTRRDGQRFLLRLNIGESPITDIYGNPFVDGAADGDDVANEADDVWEGVFTSGDTSQAPIPPRLQLNDGRYYSPFPGGTTAGATVSFGNVGTYVHLAHGIMGRYRHVCAGGSPEPRLHELGLLFATPDALQHEIGDDDLLNPLFINDTNFGLFRVTDLPFEPLPLEVAGNTVHVDFYVAGELYEKQAATLVTLSPAPTNGDALLAGDDRLCGTADDRLVEATRPWQTGDRILISHRIQFSGSDENTLDGNYDGILDDNAADDMIFEYRPGNGVEPFVPVRERR